MNIDFDSIADFPDPAADLAHAPKPARPTRPLARPPTRGQVAVRRIMALCAAALYEGAWLCIFRGRGDLGALPTATLLTEIAIPLAAAAVGLAAATGRGSWGLGPSRARLATGVLMSPVFFATATWLTGPPDVDHESFFPHAIRCFLVTALLGAGPLVLAGWAFRHTFAAAPAWKMAALGMACGASGAATMGLLCSVGSPGHVLVGHGGPMVAAALVGALLGRRVGQA